MKITISFIIIFLCYFNLNAQSKTISQAEYESAFNFAVSETNAVYPHIFEVITDSMKAGKLVRRVTEINENEAPLRHRTKTTTLENGKETSQYQINIGSGNVFCSEDGKIWKPSKYECDSFRTIYGPRSAETTEYSVTEKKLNGQTVKVYREYSVFAPSEASGKKTFQEKVSTINSQGLFINIEGFEGTLDPKIITLSRKQIWTLKAKFKPVVSPIK